MQRRCISAVFCPLVIVKPRLNRRHTKIVSWEIRRSMKTLGLHDLQPVIEESLPKLDIIPLSYALLLQG